MVLQDCFEITNWQMLVSTADGYSSEYTDSVIVIALMMLFWNQSSASSQPETFGQPGYLR